MGAGPDPDAIVIGSGPNGLVAAATLARRGWSVQVLERASVAGGAIRSEALTAPGFVHDTFSAFYGILHSSPVFRDLGLDRGVAWAHAPAPVGAAVSPERAAVIHAGAPATSAALAAISSADGAAWNELTEWWARVGDPLLSMLLAPLPSVRPALRVLRRTGIRSLPDVIKMQLEPLEAFARGRFASPEAQALVAAGASHTDLGVDAAGSTPSALILALVAQARGMPVPVGGAGRLAEALVRSVEEAGGTVTTGADITRVIVERGRAVGVETADGSTFRARRAVIADTGPARLFADLVGEEHVPSAFLRGVQRFRYGTGVFKVDLALDGAVPWTAPGLGSCAVVHLVGDLDTMARSAFDAGRHTLPRDPLLVVGQQSVADSTRAPTGKHTLWIETHVPPVPRHDAAGNINGDTWAVVRDPFLDRVLTRLEAHAPGLRELIAGTFVQTPVDLEAANPNLVGGDLAGGSTALDQQVIFRPVPGWFRYATPVRGLYLCSASAHPGGAVHGMGGRNCARRVLADARLRRLRKRG